MNVSLHRLRTLREVARVGGVVAAADVLHYSPSTVSQQLDTLSTEIGAPVLERVGRGVRLTDVGRVLIEHAEVLLAEEDRAITAIEQARQGLAARLRIGVFATAASSLLPTALNDLAQRYPEIVLESEEVEVEDAVENLRHGQLDLAMMLDYPDAPERWNPELSVVPIGIDQLHLAVPTASSIENGASLTEVADQNWILSGADTYYGRAIRAACRAAGFEPTVRHKLDSPEASLAMVAAGLGVTLATDLGQHPNPPSGFRTVRMDTPLQRTIVIAQQPHIAERPTVDIVHNTFIRAAADHGLAPGR